MPNTHIYVLPTKPITLAEEIARYRFQAFGVGNPDPAANGDSVNVHWDMTRNRWLGSYKRNDVAQIISTPNGSLEECLKAAKQRYLEQGRGASVIVSIGPFVQQSLLIRGSLLYAAQRFCQIHGYILSTEEDRSWRTWQFDEVSPSVTLDLYHNTSFFTSSLIEASSREDYYTRIESPDLSS